MIKKMWVIREIDTKILKVMNKNKFKVKTLSHLGYNKYIIDNHNNYNIKDYEQIPVFVTDEDPLILLRECQSKISVTSPPTIRGLCEAIDKTIKNWDDKTK